MPFVEEYASKPHLVVAGWPDAGDGHAPLDCTEFLPDKFVYIPRVLAKEKRGIL
jgi:hypothetical protein